MAIPKTSNISFNRSLPTSPLGVVTRSMAWKKLRIPFTLEKTAGTPQNQRMLRARRAERRAAERTARTEQRREAIPAPEVMQTNPVEMRTTRLNNPQMTVKRFRLTRPKRGAPSVFGRVKRAYWKEDEKRCVLEIETETAEDYIERRTLALTHGNEGDE